MRELDPSLAALSMIAEGATAAGTQPPRYRILSRIGSGGMGEAFLAVMHCVGGATKPVVLKRLWPVLALNRDFAAMFLDEARLSLRLNHPNVIHAYEAGWQDGFYLALEHMEGVSLKQLILRLAPEGGLALPLALKVVSEVLAGLEYVHELREVDGRPLGIVHRDVSPHNVVITYDGAVKLVDFGVATSVAASQAHRKGLVSGRLSYMSPEQSRGDEVDRRADLFSVGVMLWELAAGRRLWAGLTQAKLARRLLTGEPAPALPVGGSVEPELAAICARALAMDPRHRYASAAEFQTALSQMTLVAVYGARQLGDLVARTFAESRRATQSMIRLNTPPVEKAGLFPGARASVAAGVPGAQAAMADELPDQVLPDLSDALEDHETSALERRPRWWLGAALALLVAGAALGLGTLRRRAPQPLDRPAPLVGSPLPIAAAPPARAPDTTAAPPADGVPPPDPRSPAMAVPSAGRAGALKGSSATRGQVEDSEKEVRQAVAGGRRTPEGGRTQIADRLLRRALPAAPGDAAALASLAEVRFELALYQDALSFARRAARLAPDVAKYQVLVGDASFKLGLDAEATAAYARARVLEPGDASIRARLDRVLPPPRSVPRAEGAKPRMRDIVIDDPYAADQGKD
jgi:eukaryotic-like serine/threonine-protein kinase